MNIKETIELIAYLKEKRNDAASMRNYYQDRLTKLTEEGGVKVQVGGNGVLLAKGDINI